LSAREARSVRVRERIFQAAAKVVGQHGYADASISRITELAGIAQGTFYLYFESRQALFDELLPHVGQDMLVFIGDAVRNATDIYDVEERGFRAFFAFLRKSPGFFRLLNEAETASPKAHATHIELLTRRYVSSMKRSMARGEIGAYDDRELEALAQVFMGARSYLYQRYLKGAKPTAKLPEWVSRTYMRLVRQGLH
jgi:AcrR family transcriptional regulator